MRSRSFHQSFHQDRRGPPAGPAPAPGSPLHLVDPGGSAQTSTQSSMQVVMEALRYFSRYGGDPIVMADLARTLGVSEACLAGSFDRIRGMTPAQALLEHRLNRLFQSLTDRPRQGLRQAIHSCGLAETRQVVEKFEQTFGIAMPLFLLTCRRADEDRRFRQQHPEPEALVLPP